MQEGIKCPNCGGDKFNFLGGNSVRCAYCGHTFTNKTQEAEVKKEVVTRVEYVQVPQQPQVQSKGKSKLVAALLAFFVGWLGIHKFYLGKAGQGILYILFCWTYIPAIVAFIETIMFLIMSDAEFDRKYNY